MLSNSLLLIQLNIQLKISRLQPIVSLWPARSLLCAPPPPLLPTPSPSPTPPPPRVCVRKPASVNVPLVHLPSIFPNGTAPGAVAALPRSLISLVMVLWPWPHGYAPASRESGGKNRSKIKTCSSTHEDMPWSTLRPHALLPARRQLLISWLQPIFSCVLMWVFCVCNIMFVATI